MFNSRFLLLYIPALFFSLIKLVVWTGAFMILVVSPSQFSTTTQWTALWAALLSTGLLLTWVVREFRLAGGVLVAAILSYLLLKDNDILPLIYMGLVVLVWSWSIVKIRNRVRRSRPTINSVEEWSMRYMGQPGSSEPRPNAYPMLEAPDAPKG